MEQHAQRGFRARIGQSVAPFDPPTIRTLKPHAFAIDRPQVATVDLLVGSSADDGTGQRRRKSVDIPLLKPPPHVTIDLLTLERARALGTRDPGIILRRPAVVGETYQPSEQRTPASNEPITPRLSQSRTRGGVNSGKVNLFSLLWPVLQPALGGLGLEMPDLPHPLKPWQIIGVRFLAKTPRAMLGDDMGLGKTIQAIVALRLLFRLGHIGSVLLLCPKSILRNWQREVQKWAPELTSVIVAGSRIERSILWRSQAHIHITTYETVRQDIEASLYGAARSNNERVSRFDCVILDEAQKIKNASSGMARAVQAIQAEWRWALTGTPLENRIEDMESIFSYLKPGLVRRDTPLTTEQFKQLIKPYFLRRLADDLPGLEPVEHAEVWLQLTPSQQRAYDRAEQQGLIELNSHGDAITVQHVLALITKLKHICNFSPVGRESAKLEYLQELLDDVTAQNEKALVFSQYPNMALRHLERPLAAYRPRIFDGTLTDRARAQIVDDFQTKEDIRVLLMSVKAGGLGITLTRANHVVHFDHWWNPAVAAQATARARRIGQTKTVFVKWLLTENTIEERIHQLLQSKRSLFKNVVDDLSDSVLTKTISEDELYALFGISRKRSTRRS